MLERGGCQCTESSRSCVFFSFLSPCSTADPLAEQLISVISLLSADTPNIDSPANIDAAKEVRDDIKNYRKKVRRLARKSAEEGF